MDYAKSPLCYTGGKYKILKDLVPLFPKNIGIFVDLFGGGFDVGANVTAETVLYNDICEPLMGILKYFYETSIDEILMDIESTIKEFGLSKTNQEGYLKLRQYYNNEDRSPVLLYTLICYAFNNQIRFNLKGQYNMPFGKDRSSFNPSLRAKLIKFHKALSKEIEFISNSFEKIDLSELNETSFVYCDSPYYNSVAVYNTGWKKEQEIMLYKLLDELNERGIKWGVSNNLQYDNPYLLEFMKKYKVINIDHNYNNCNYQKKDKENISKEIYIYNY